MQGQITIHELTAMLLAEFRRAGYRESTIWRNYMPDIRTIEKYYEKTSHLFYDPFVTEEFMRIQRERYDRKELSGYYFSLNLAASRMNELYMTGKISIAPVVHGTEYILNAEHARLLDLFLAAKNYGPNTRNDAAWAVRKYLNYFERNGCSLFKATVDDARAFLFQTASEVKISTLHMMDAVSVGDMFQKYQKQAGIVRQPFDGKGFHGLRRRLAKKLIVARTPLTTVAQILGHNDMHSSRQYLSLDTGNLKECALDFTDIPVTGRAFK